MALPRKLTKFPRMALEELDMLRGTAHELDLLARFGEPTHEERDGDEPAFYWDLEFACGMVMAIAFRQLTQQISVQLDAPELEHAQRHLGVGICGLATIETLHPERYEELRPGLPPATWMVWRDEPGGVTRPVASGLVPRDAQCLADELRDRGDGAFEAGPG